MTLELDLSPADAGASLAGCGDAGSTRALIRDILVRVSDKWTILVVQNLAAGPMRFTALQGAVKGISHRMLTRTLRALERDGMVTRTPYAQVPPRVDYALTPLGATLIEPVQAVVDWAERHQDEVEANRAAFDA
ncbi:helix-turn-helix domain-containing protein [Gryllotalpicola sp.]|uniref:winged helix-turn-helix transcriptional regulator n=1 Tax=Gryllotalpicola sp. TaxID=1932787 RepID=UPI0026272A0B|nr:helix-turn-helix domain-containing protein [Gryllotalpicola sp.]